VSEDPNNNYNETAPRRLAFRRRDLRLRAVENLLELRDAVAHARVHIRFGALDVVVQVVAEELDVRDGAGRGERGEVPREEHEGDVADLIRVAQAGDRPYFKRRFAVGEEHLRSVLNLR